MKANWSACSGCSHTAILGPQGGLQVDKQEKTQLKLARHIDEVTCCEVLLRAMLKSCCAYITQQRRTAELSTADSVTGTEAECCNY